MEKKLYIRYFCSVDDVDTSNSKVVWEKGSEIKPNKAIEQYSSAIIVWLGINPTGKVDFVWL